MHGLLAISSVRESSPTFDEPAHLIAGVSLWKTGDYRMVPEHPPLPHLWAALPVVVLGLHFPDRLLEGPDWFVSDPWDLGVTFLYHCGNNPQAMLTWSRGMIVVLSVLLGLVVWLWSRRLFGEVGGMISLLLYAFSPTVLAHGSLITTDLAAALAFLVAVAALWRVLHRLDLRGVLVSALCTSALLLSKMSGLIVLPIAAVLVFIRLFSSEPAIVAWRGPRQIHRRASRAAVWALMALLHLPIILLVIWGTYSFRYTAMRHARPGRDRLPQELREWPDRLSDLDAGGALIRRARDLRLLPEAYLFGLAYTLQRSPERPAFLEGHRWRGGRWYYFPYTFAVKTPLPLFVILAMAMLARPKRCQEPSAGRSTEWWRGWQAPMPPDASSFFSRTIPLWTLMSVYSFSAIVWNLNAGQRHLLPIYPVLFILAGRASHWLASPWRPARWIVPVAVLLFAASSVRTWPHYLGYFNVLAGGPANGWRHLVDSSLDWGQDLSGLKRRLDREVGGRAPSTAGMPRVYLSYFGSVPPQAYGIEATALPSYRAWGPLHYTPLTGGIYCISATMLQQVYLLDESRWTRNYEARYQRLRQRLPEGNGRQTSSLSAQVPAGGLNADDLERLARLQFARLCAYLRRRGPDDNVGYSILIYRLTDAEVHRALYEEPP
jgi:4-amino-4-deoxy-L-arabinose transferase-like glycosyltransferase